MRLCSKSKCSPLRCTCETDDGVVERLARDEMRLGIRAHEIGAAAAGAVEHRRRAVGIDDDRAAPGRCRARTSVRASGRRRVGEDAREEDDHASEPIAHDEVRVGNRSLERRPCEEARW